MKTFFQLAVSTAAGLMLAGPALAANQSDSPANRSNAAPQSPGPRTRAANRPGFRPITEAAKVERDVIYGRGGPVDLKLDLYFPKDTGAKLLPVVMYVHGGGWQNGDKTAGAGMLAVPELLTRGYLVASINYRLAPEYKFPAQIEDVKCAVRFLRAHAKDYQLDPNRIGALGGSAGGHLVALLGVSSGAKDLEGQGGWPDQSSRVEAVVDLFGPTDLTLSTGAKGSRLGENVFGAKSADDPILKRASPVTYVSKDNPPFLILHGDHDPVVPLRHSEKLLEKLKAAGVSAALVVVTNAAHGFAPAGGEPNPNRAALARIIADFCDRHLKQGRATADKEP